MKYPDYKNKILCGHTLEVLKQMPDQVADMLITSPPYNVGIDYGVYKDNLSEKEYLQFLDDFIGLSKRVLKKDGRLAIVIPGGIGRNPYIAIGYKTIAICEKYMKLRGAIIWYKGLMHGKTAWGSWKSPSNPGLRDMSELIIIAHNEEAQKITKGKTDLSAQEFMLYSNDIWFIPPDRKREFHPAPFPEEIPIRLIKFYTYVGDLIIDPFIGCGTTALAAKKLNRNYCGIDISENYCKIARERLMAVPENLPFE